MVVADVLVLKKLRIHNALRSNMNLELDFSIENANVLFIYTTNFELNNWRMDMGVFGFSELLGSKKYDQNNQTH